MIETTAAPKTKVPVKKPVFPTVTMTPVESSNVAAIGYLKPDLYVRFHGGGEYRYSNVPENLFHDFMAADSKGGFLSSHIKGKFAYAKTTIKEGKPPVGAR